MDYRNETVETFFACIRTYKIPIYQRTYSWNEDQLKTFFEDLCDCLSDESRNSYSFGNIMAEKIDEKTFEIIDGQQRLTTIVIFIRALLNELQNRQNELSCFDFDREYSIFFKYYGQVKIVPLNLDNTCFNTIIIENKNEFRCETLSQEKIVNAKKYFSSLFQNIDTKKIIKLYQILKKSKLNFISLEGKKESALMFELQNNRGLPLNTLDKIKSFLMYQIYIHSEVKETDFNVNYVSEKFASIYRFASIITNNLSNHDISEDSVLLYHSYAFSSKNFYYRNIDDLKDEYKNVQEDRIMWIKNYVDELNLSYSNMSDFLSYDNENIKRLKKIGLPFFVYPFIIKAMKYFNKDDNKMNIIFEIMEKLTFRYKLVNSRSDIRGQLNSLIKDFNNNVEIFVSELKNKMEKSYYWSDSRVIEILNGNMYKYGELLHYLLWEYEAHLQPKGYKIGDIHIEDECIEHISPQTENNEWVESGYEVDENNQYIDGFRENYLNKIGNLLLISKTHNSSIGNRPFKEKLDSYCNPILIQQSEIKNFVENLDIPLWNIKSIELRHKKILEFAKARWSLKI